jgi:hypothetical protein
MARTSAPKEVEQLVERFESEHDDFAFGKPRSRRASQIRQNLLLYRAVMAAACCFSLGSSDASPTGARIGDPMYKVEYRVTGSAQQKVRVYYRRADLELSSPPLSPDWYVVETVSVPWSRFLTVRSVSRRVTIKHPETNSATIYTLTPYLHIAAAPVGDVEKLFRHKYNTRRVTAEILVDDSLRWSSANSEQSLNVVAAGTLPSSVQSDSGDKVPGVGSFLTGLIPLCLIAVLILVPVLLSARRKKRQAMITSLASSQDAASLVVHLSSLGAQICPNCRYVGEAKINGNGAVELILWLFLLVPGLIYSLWRRTSARHGCPKCAAPNMVPLETPRGRELMAERGANR